MMTQGKKAADLFSTLLTGVLVAANLVVANIVLRKVDARWDLTEDHRFEISTGTRRIIERLEDTVNVKVYLSGNLPRRYSHCERTLIEKLKEYERLTKDRPQSAILWSFADPSANEEAKQECQDMNLLPLQLQEFEDTTTPKLEICWLAMVFRYGDRKVTYNFLTDMPPQNVEDAGRFATDLEFVMTRSIRNVTHPRKTIGLLAEVQMVPTNGMDPRSEKRPMQGLEFIQQALERTHDVVKLDIAKVNRGEPIPAEIDAMIIWRPKAVTEVGCYVIDQFIVRGGNALFMVDNAEIDFNPRQKPSQYGNVTVQDFELASYKANPIASGLDDLLASYGLRVEQALVEDESAYDVVYVSGKSQPKQNPFTGQVAVEPVQAIGSYVSWPVVPARGEDGEVLDPHQVGGRYSLLSPNDEYVHLWASPVTVLEDAVSRYGGSVETLIETGPRSWIVPIKESVFSPDPERRRDLRSQEPRRSALGLLLRGRFPSAFKGKEIPQATGTAGQPLPNRDELEKSRRDDAAKVGTIILIGDADFCADGILGQAVPRMEQYRAQMKGGRLANDPKHLAKSKSALFLVSNCADLLAFGDEASDFFELQHRTFRSREIRRLTGDDPDKSLIQTLNFTVVPGLVLLVGFAVWLFRWALGRSAPRPTNRNTEVP